MQETGLRNSAYGADKFGFKGLSAVRSELAVGVSVGAAQVFSDPTVFTPWMSREATAPLGDQESQQQQ